MPNSNSFWNHPIEKLEEALHLRKQINALQIKLRAMFGSEPEPAKTAKPVLTTVTMDKKAKRRMSPATIANMRAAQQARWAKIRGTTDAPVAAKAPKKTGGITAEGRARLAAAMKARWAARKKGASAAKATA